MRKAWMIAGIIVALDQITKALFRSLEPIEVIDGFFRLSVTFNTGAGFSILRGHNTLLIIISAAVIGYLVYYLRKSPSKQHAAIALVIGGASSNLLDRILFGSVTDFLAVWIWPVFNVADIAITAGVGLLIYQSIRD